MKTNMAKGFKLKYKRIKPLTPRKRKQLIAGVTAIALMIVALVFVLASCSAASKAKELIQDNVYVGTINVGGMNRAQAAKAIEKGFNEYIQDKSVTLVSGDKEHIVKIAALNPVPQSKKLAKKAASVGRGVNIFKKIVQKSKLKKGKKEIITMTMTFDDEILASEISYFGSSLLETEGVVTFDEEKKEVTLDIEKATRAVDTEKTAKELKKLVNSGKYGKLEIGFTSTPDGEKCAEVLYEMIVREPVDAKMIFEGGALDFTDEIEGIDIDKESLLKAVDDGVQVTLPYKVIPPAVTKDDLKKQAFSVTLASYTSYFDPSVAGRTNNIRKAVERINGYIMMPGDEFSYNRVLGERTVAAGYDYANSYSGGTIIQEVGGGICQVSSTLYVAVLYADLKVTKRYNHSLAVSYVPKGMDATVSYGTLDFCFANDTQKPIMIKASVNGGVVDISIVGFEKDENKKVEIYTKTTATREFDEKVVEDPNVYVRNIKQFGVNGSTVETYKKITIDGVEVSNNRITVSNYMPQTQIVHVPPEPAPAPEQPAAPAPTTEAAPVETAQ